jgi:hypothetical protein
MFILPWCIEQVVASVSLLTEDIPKNWDTREVFHLVYLETQGEVVETRSRCS